MNKEDIKIPSSKEWREILTAQLLVIQNKPENQNVDIMTMSGFCKDRFELWNYVKFKAA